MFNFPLPEPKASLCVWWVSFFHVTSAYHTDDTTAHQHNIEYKPFCHFFFFLQERTTNQHATLHDHSS